MVKWAGETFVPGLHSKPPGGLIASGLAKWSILVSRLKGLHLVNLPLILIIEVQESLGLEMGC
jgi:hypothetical protein